MGRIFIPTPTAGEWVPPHRHHKRPYNNIHHTLYRGQPKPDCTFCGRTIEVLFGFETTHYQRYGNIIACQNPKCRNYFGQVMDLADHTHLTNQQIMTTVAGPGKAFKVPGVIAIDRLYCQRLVVRAGVPRILAMALDPESGEFSYAVGTRGAYQFWRNPGNGNVPVEVWPRKGRSDGALRRFMVEQHWGYCPIRAVPVPKPVPYGTLMALYLAVDYRAEPGMAKVRNKPKPGVPGPVVSIKPAKPKKQEAEVENYGKAMLL